ncbi:uncharacterized protein [Mytilus edulis]|uniref:uncharacterized protein isoform X1 n=1 Tax=Mytilus edulis TaxID=6550 RepID=UPI0039F0308D
MNNPVIIVVLISSVIYIKTSDRVVVKSCYRYESSWTYFRFNATLTNIWCENQCKKSVDNYRYCGTLFKTCYCRETELSEHGKQTNKCNTPCPGNNNETCGMINSNSESTYVTVSEIDKSVTVKYTQETTATSVSIRDSTTTDFMNMKTSDTSVPTKSTPYPIQELVITTSKNAYTAISTVLTENTSHTTKERLTETMTITNTQASGTTFVSMRDSTSADFMKIITSDTSAEIVTQSTPSIIQEVLSTTTENVDTTISTVMTSTLTQATTANEEWGIWNDWKFCEVNCAREDTTNGTQRRWRTCNGLECSGKDMEERACSEPEICKGMRPRKLLCKCPKRFINTKWHFLDGMNITNAEVKKIVLEDFNKNTKSEISVNKKTVSKEVRKKNSSVNQTKSSQFIGWGCIVFLVLPMIFLIAIDILNCCIHFRSRFGGRKRNRNRPISNTQLQRERLKPLQENVNAAESY